LNQPIELKLATGKFFVKLANNNNYINYIKSLIE